MNPQRQFQVSSSWWLARLALALMLLILYGWTVFEPYAGDALMHMMDDTQIHSLGDVLRTFYSTTNPAYQEQHRLTVFHRPIFNELYLSTLKKMFGVGSEWMRVMTLAMLVGIGWAFLSLMRKMHVGTLSAMIGAAWLVFSPPLFFGLYEYGLAFSQLLVLLAVLSLLALHKYIDCRNQPISRLWLIGTVFLVFLAVFTKESAVAWPIICVLMAVYFSNDNQIISDKKPLSFFDQTKCLIHIFYTFRWLAFALITLTLLYFSTRYIKLGSITAIAGGIEQTPSLVDALIKLGGFTLLALQVPSPAIPGFMTLSLQNMGGVEIIFRVFLFISALWSLWAGWRKSRVATSILFVAFVFAFLPIIKVSRNAPYYGDLMAIPLAIALGIGFEAIRGRVSRLTHVIVSVLVIISLIVAGAFFAGRYVYNPDMWIARSQGFVRSALADFSSAEGANEAMQIVGASGMFSPEQNWALNHNSRLFGAAFIVNLGIPKEKFVLNSEKLLHNDKVMFIDFYPDMHSRKVGAYPLPGYGRLTTAYFPSGFIRKVLKNSEGIFNIKSYKVIRLECDNPFQKPFEVEFESHPESKLLRLVDSAMNINLTPDRLVLEFVAPPNADSLVLLDDAGNGCRSPKVSGYLSLDPSSLRYTSTINASPRFEKDSDWKGKLTKSPLGLGVVVGPGPDNPNVLLQRFTVKPFDMFKIVARASSVSNQAATGRLQINWIGSNEQFISSSGKAIEVTKDEKVFETYVVAPAGAIAGYLYVVPHSPNDVVRYTEMRLLGTDQDNENE